MARSAEQALAALEDYVSRRGGEIFAPEVDHFYKSSGADSDTFKAVFSNGKLRRVLENHPNLQFVKDGKSDLIRLKRVAGGGVAPQGAAKASLGGSDREGKGGSQGKGNSKESKNQSQSTKQGKGGECRSAADQALAALEDYVSNRGGEIFAPEVDHFYKSSGADSDTFKEVFSNGKLRRVLENHPNLQFVKDGKSDLIRLKRAAGGGVAPKGVAKASLGGSDREGKGGRGGKGNSKESKNQSQSTKRGKGGESRGAAEQDNGKFKGASGGSKAKTNFSSSHKSDSQISPDLENFLKRLSLSGGRAILTQYDVASLDLWHRCWRAAASGAKFPYIVVLDTLLLLPVSAAFSPTAKELSLVLLDLVRIPDNSKSTLKTISILEKVVDAIEHRLDDALKSITGTQDATDVAKIVGEIPSLFHRSIVDLLSTGDGALVARATPLLNRFNIAVKSTQSALKALPTSQAAAEGASDANSKQQPWHGWHQKPTVGWLANGEWLNAPQLRPRYESVSDYIETLQRMMTLLTFYWGAGALWPKCRHRQGGGHAGDDSKCCNEPLLVMCGSSTTASCSVRHGSSSCGRKAQWRCARSSHLSHAICEDCLRRQQASILGRTGNSAAAASSTDIYDAVVDRETSRRDGQVFLLSGLTSRRPPNIDPNWKTSYRLKCSALVAVVRLDVSGEALNYSHPIQWAEIVPFSQTEGANQDFAQRSKKRLALRPLMSEDVNVLENEQFLQAGRRIAVIDLRVFVPEVVSVLGTIFQPNLNLHFNRIPFSSHLIGCGAPSPAILLTPATGIETVITEAIHGSEMKVLQRLPPEIRDKLCRDLAKLGRDANLYGTQLAAFVEALRCSLHCTQGPPGTGKSYVGVQLILALDRIRDAAEDSGQALGPIVVLSYKNHALDEVLLDLLGSPNCSAAMKRTLIRCGNPESEALQLYREKNSQLERSAEEELSKRLLTLRQANRTAKDWYDLGILLTLACAELKNQNSETALDDIPVLSEWAPGRAENNAERPDSRSGSNVVEAATSALRFLLSKDCEQCSNTPSNSYKVLGSLVSAKVSRGMNHLLVEDNRLMEEAEHWVQKEASSSVSPSVFVLTKFLQGATPPPRCKYHKEDSEDNFCNMVVPLPGKYCVEVHGCCEPSGTCTERRTSEAHGVKFCDTHRCKEVCHRPKKDPQPCKNISVANSQCCSGHGCPLCMELHAVQVFPKQPHACQAHQCQATGCQFPQMNPDHIPFCKNHACSICQRPSEVILSVQRVGGSPFCKSHKCADSACMDSRLRGVQVFCPKHACRKCEGRREHVDPLCMVSSLCREHRCAHSDSVCSSSRKDGSDFCELHTCFICVRLGIQGNRGVTDEAPRNVCPEHVLCAETLLDGTLCCELIAGNGPFCEAHRRLATRKKQADAVVTTRECQCSGITSKKKRCKTKGYAAAGRNFYCSPHFDQAPESSSDSSDSDEEFFEAEMEAHFSGPDGTWDMLADSEQNTSASKLEATPKEENDRATNDDENLCQAIALSLLTIDVDELGAGDGQAAESTISLPAPRSVSDDRAIQEVPVDSVSDHNFFPEEEFEEDVWHEADAADIHPDELDYDDEDDQELDMEQERLQQTLGEDLYTSGDADSDDNDFEDEITTMPNTLAGLEEISGIEDLMERMNTWSWDMTTAQRWAEVGMLLRFASSSVKDLKAQSESFVDEARQQRAQAAGQSFKKAHLIGATVVGATRRLEALRSAEPFAMVVEEACEVMEPTLMSVLSVRSLQKLELIGDHRQLPAFVQNCWFNLETTHPSIKISLFERLVTGRNSRSTRASDEAEGVASFTCLDEQRRMRPAIADLTREEYTDLVTIFDHSYTKDQLVGDKAFLPKPLPPAFTAVRELWSHRGARVPGILPQEFFWDLPNNSEGRPVAGLSACNYVEAEHVAALTSYLILCGVPPPSISIITPYKGQMMCIRKLLQKTGAISFSTFGGKGGKGKGGKGKGGKGGLHSWGKGKGGASTLGNSGGKGVTVNPGHVEAASVIVSTVDRYQGDENDIVILSLVRTKPGNRFVALHNRYIVAASRARLGFFILGSTAAVETGSNGKPIMHWSKLLEHLRTPGSIETSGSAQSTHTNALSNLQNEPSVECRVGNSIKLCCPRHKNTVKVIQNPGDFPQNSTWSAFCSLPCTFQLDWCNHYCGLSCHSPQKQPHTSPGDCAHPLARPCPDHSEVPLLCGSIYSASSQNLDEALEHFKCDQPVKYERPECEHVVKLQCHERTALENPVPGGFSLGLCSKIVEDFVHPECNHVIRRPTCSERRRFELNPPRCMEEVKIVKVCGCTAALECWKAIQELNEPSICTKAKKCHRPRCTHILSMRCCESTTLQEKWESCDGVSASVDHGITVVEEGVHYGPSEADLISSAPRCSVGVKFKGLCGHISETEEPCNVAFEMAEGTRPPLKCTHLTEFPSPICSHLVQAECSIKSNEAVRSFTSPFLALPRIDGQPVAHEDSLAPLTLFPAPERRKLERACGGSVLVKRRCGHCTPMQCARLSRSVKHHEFPACEVPVDRHLRCGHIVQVACDNRDDELEPLCRTAVDDAYVYPCGVHSVHPGVCADLSALKAVENPHCPTILNCHHYRCGHEVSVPCWLKSHVTQPTVGKRIRSGKDGGGIVASGEVYCKIMGNVPQCNKPVTFRYTQCGHEKPGLPCHQAFEWAEAMEDEVPPCCHEVEVTSPICGHVQSKVPCWEARLLSDWMPWSADISMMPEFTDDFDAQGEGMTCRIFQYERNRPLPPPRQLSKSTLQCEEFSYVERSCGHTDRVPCAQVFQELDAGRCMEDIPEVCKECNHETMTPCFQKQARDKSGLNASCVNKVMKSCQRCNINQVSTECSKQDVQCISEVSCTLPCGHVVSWMCGHDGKAGEDPRVSQDTCVACTLPLWKAAKDAPDFSDDHKAALLFNLRKHALSQLPVVAKICDQVNESNTLLDAVFGAWMQIINVNLDLLQQSFENNTKDGLMQVQFPPRLDEVSSYDVVFTSTSRGGFKQRSTRYGQGTIAHLLSLGTLLKEAEANEDGMMSISVGVAFRYQALEEMLPFRGGGKANKKSNKEEAKVNRKRAQKLEAGFDYVIPLNDEGEPIASRRIYWLPGAVSKLFTLRLQLEEHERCLICGDETPVAKGFSCDNDGGPSHFTCDECFTQHVKSKVDSDLCELRLRKAAKGHVFCPSRRTDREGNAIDCTSSQVSEADVLQHARSAFDAFLKNRDELLTIELRASITEEQKKLLEAEKERLARMSAQEREVHLHRTHIVDEILTLKCPRPDCRAAFLDFEGCFALKCSQCNCGFCGWCLADCGRDAHAHVAACPHKVGGQMYHGSDQQFKQVHKPRREREVRNYLLRQIADKDIQRRTIAQSRKDFEDLGMLALMNEFGGAAAEEGQDAGARGAMEVDEELAYALQADDLDA